MATKLATHRLTTLLLIAVIGLGLVARLYRFGQIPTSLNRDEAALGYNAFTIGNYGTDEWGFHLPFMFISFGDYKLPGYIYALVPPIKLFGVHNWVIRLPSLFAGLGLIILAYLIIDRIGRNRQLALLGAAVISVSPWAIFYSRTAFEAHLALFFLVACIYLMMLPFKKIYLGGMALTYALAVVTYNTPLLLAPAIILFGLVLPGKTKAQKIAVGGVLLGIATVFLLIFWPLTVQKQNITIFSDPTLQTKIRESRIKAITIPERILKNQVVQESELILNRLAQSLGPRFLVTKGGDHPWHAIPGQGHFALTVYLLSLVSLGLILSGRIPKATKFYPLLGLMFFALAPSIVTVDSPHATRSLLFFFILGLMATWVVIKWPKTTIIIAWAILGEGLLYTYRYFWLYPREMPSSWPTGIEFALEEAWEQQYPNQPIVFTNAPGTDSDISADQVYIYTLLYGQSRPLLKFNQQPKDVAGIIHVNRAGDFLFINNRLAVPPGSIIIERTAGGFYKLK